MRCHYAARTRLTSFQIPKQSEKINPELFECAGCEIAQSEVFISRLFNFLGRYLNLHWIEQKEQELQTMKSTLETESIHCLLDCMCETEAPLATLTRHT